MSLAFRVHVCVHMHSHAQSSSLKLWWTLSSLETSAKLHFHDADHHHHEKHIIVPNLPKCILTLWFIKQVRFSRPIWSGCTRQDPLSTAISLVAFASFPQTIFATLSLLQQQLTCHLFVCWYFCHHQAPIQWWWYCVLFHINTNPSGKTLTSFAQWNSWFGTNVLWETKMIHHSVTCPLSGRRASQAFFYGSKNIAELYKVTMQIFNVSLMQNHSKAKVFLQLLFRVIHQGAVWEGISLANAAPFKLKACCA